jgi:Hg(II)-responsive transcriptional regulator
MRTGQLAAEAGVNIETLRYYERRGILARPKRAPSSGYREYPPDAVRLIRFIKRAQDLGFTLAEIQELVRLRHNKRASCAEVRAAAEAKVADIEAKIASLRSMKRALGVLVAACGGREALTCPILESLEAPEERSKQ